MAMTQQEAIKKFMASLDKTTKSGEKAIDEAIKAMGISKVSNAKDAIEKMLSDCKNAKNADDFLKNYCGINLDNADTGAIIGFDAGGSKTEINAEDIVFESKNAKLKERTQNSFTVRGLTFKIGENKTYNDLTKDRKFIWNSLYSYWAESALKLNEDSYGFSFYDSDISVKEIEVRFFNNPSLGADVAYTRWYDGYEYGEYDGKVDKMELYINMAIYYNFKSTDKNGIAPDDDGGYLDRTIAHEMTHAIMNAKINHSYKIPNFIDEGLAELTHGIDDERHDRILEIVSNSNRLKSALSLTRNSSNSDSTSDEYAAGYIFMRYLAKQAAINSATTPLNLENYTSKISISGTALNDTVQNSGNNVTIQAGAGNDSIVNLGVNPTVTSYSAGKNVIIYGGAGKDNIENHGQKTQIVGGDDDDTITNSSYGINATIIGGNGNDSIKTYNADNVLIDGGAGADKISLGGSVKGVSVIGGAGNDSITLSGGNNFVQYASGDGNDTITGITANDTIKITGAEYEPVTTSSSNDVTLKVGNGSMVVKNAKNISFTVIGTIIPDNPFTSGNDSYTNNSANVTLNALAGNDYVENNASNVTIYGGKGKDTIKNNGAGNVIIKGENDADSITSYGNNITIDGGKGDNYVLLYNDSSNVSVKTDSGKDTIYSGGQKVTINSGTGNDYVYLYTASSNVSVDAGSGNDEIYSGGKNILIDGGADNDYIHLFLSSDDVSVKAGKGNDNIRSYSTLGNVFQYANGDGNDTITGITANDTIKISGAKYSTVKSGSDLRVIVGSGSILLKNAANIAVKMDGTLDGGITIKNSVATASSSFKGNKIDLSDYPTATKVNAAAVSQAVSIVGSSAANSLKGGKGADTISAGAGNDTVYGGAGNDKIYGDAGNDKLYGDAGNDSLYGGAGNDTFTGGAGNDVFIYSSGKDVITDYAAGDSIRIESGKISKTTYSGKNVIFTIGSGTLTVKNGKGKNISVTDSSGTKTYSKTLDLFEDNNYITDSAQLSDITEKKFAVTQVQTPNYSALEQINQTFLTYGKEK